MGNLTRGKIEVENESDGDVQIGMNAVKAGK